MGNLRTKTTNSILKTATGEDYSGNRHALHTHSLGGSVSIVQTVTTTPTIFNITAAVANTEYSQALPANTKKFILSSRNSAKITFYYSPGATETLTINPGFGFEDNNFYTAQTIYFKCSKSDVIEVVAYT